MAPNRENSRSPTPRQAAASLNRSVSESADSELAFQMQLDEVLAASLAMELPSRPPSTDSITEVDFEVGETSRGSFEQEPHDAEWIEDDPHDYAFVHALAADGLNQGQDRDDVVEALKEEYRMFHLSAISQEDGIFARMLNSLPEGDHELGKSRAENPGDPLAYQSEGIKKSPLTVTGTPYVPRARGRVRVRPFSRTAEAAAGIRASRRRTTCTICLTTVITSSNSHVISETCNHRFCTDCLRKHGETTVKSGKSHISCPEYECEESLSTRMCELILSSDALLMLNRRQVEDALAVSERVYCPYNDCSLLQLRPLGPTPTQTPAAARVQCLSCHRYFCLECQVPWHDDVTCEEYKRLPEGERSPQDIALLKGLVAKNKWQRCTCGHIVEKTVGCNHISCRCGKEFCYVCGQEWMDHLYNLHTCRRPCRRL